MMTIKNSYLAGLALIKRPSGRKVITTMTIIMKMIRMMTLGITIIVASSALPNAAFERYIEERQKNIMMTRRKAMTMMTSGMKMIRMMTLMITIIVASSTKSSNKAFKHGRKWKHACLQIGLLDPSLLSDPDTLKALTPEFPHFRAHTFRSCPPDLWWPG